MSMCSTYCCMFEWNIGVNVPEGGDSAETRSSLVVVIIQFVELYTFLCYLNFNIS